MKLPRGDVSAISELTYLLMDCEEVAARLGVYKATVRCWIIEGKLPAVYIDNTWVMHRADVERFFEQLASKR